MLNKIIVSTHNICREYGYTQDEDHTPYLCVTDALPGWFDIVFTPFIRARDCRGEIAQYCTFTTGVVAIVGCCGLASSNGRWILVDRIVFHANDVKMDGRTRKWAGQYMKFKKFTGNHTIEESRTTFHTSFLQRNVVSSSTAVVLKSSPLTVERKYFSVTTEYPIATQLMRGDTVIPLMATLAVTFFRTAPGNLLSKNRNQ